MTSSPTPPHRPDEPELSPLDEAGADLVAPTLPAVKPGLPGDPGLPAGQLEVHAAGLDPRRLVLGSLETPTLTKAELSEMLFDRIGLNKREAKEMVDAFFERVHGSLVAGDDVKLSGFGNFAIRRKASRPGRNPRTGESIPIKARNVVTFHASQKLKDVVQGGVAAGDD